jgi:DNA polymerase elongation subunit (family B)
MLKCFHICDIDPVGWIRVDNPEPWRSIARDDVAEYRVQHYTDLTSADITDTPKLVLASWDIECVSGSGNFPDGSLMSDAVITIGTSYMMYGDHEPFKRTIHQLGTCNPIEGADLYTYDRESDLINAWILETQRMGVDVLLGYNTWGFDSKYIDDRASTLIDLQTGDSAIHLNNFGKAVQGGGEVVQKMLSSSAYGSNNYFYHATPGVIQLDLLMIFRKELKLESYTLDNVCKTYLGEMTKIDLKPHQIFECYKQDGPEGRTRIAEYCARDCDLPLLLVNKMHVLTNQLEMAKVVCVPIEYLNTRGQQIRCYSQIARMTRTRGYAIQDVDKGKKSDTVGFVGATVLEPEKGAYMHDIVSGLDFASLYPSIMRAHTMCPSTIVLNEAWKDIDGVDYYTVETTPGRFVSFAQDTDAVVPTLLANLAAWRKKSKRDMAEAKASGDSFASSLHNAKQLAYKVSMNSIYGFFGATVGMIPLLDLASAVTATGRNMILHTKTMCEEAGHRVVYGDSVASYTPVYIRRHGRVQLVTFDALSDTMEWVPRDDGKEYGFVPGLETWSDDGWTPVDAVIRHNHTDDLVRVCTHTGIVDVTKHHSLLRPDGEMIKPDDVRVGDALMHASVPVEAVRSLGVPSETVVEYSETQIDAARTYRRLVSMGYDVSIVSIDASYTVHATRQRTVQGTEVLAKYTVPYSGYVYDFTTGNHHFSAGIGEMVVHNTDSVMTILNLGEENRLNRALHMEKAKELADAITKTFKAPNELEYEKIYTPYLLFSKKRYAALMYEDDPEKPSYIDVKGLQLVRRDNAPIVRDISKEVLDILMYKRSFSLAMTSAKKRIMEVLQGTVPWEKFIVSKALRTGYKNPDALPHVVVAEKRKRRGNPPASGERVPYVFVIDQLKSDLLQSQRAEDPEYAKEHGLSLDVLYYIRNQIVSPITALLQLEYANAGKALLEDRDIQDIVVRLQANEVKNIKEAKRVRFVKEKQLREITDFFKKKPSN